MYIYNIYFFILFYLIFSKINFPFVLILILIILFSRFLNIYICTKLLNRSRKEPLDTKKQFFLWFAGCRGAMAFALSIKSIIDFPEKGKVFLVLTLIIALFTLIYSTLFLDYTLNKCGIINLNTNRIENSQSQSINANFNANDNDINNNNNNLSMENKDNLNLNLIKNSNCFDLFKMRIINFNKNYLKKFIKKTNSLNNNNNNLNTEIEDVYDVNIISKRSNNNYNDYDSNCRVINSNSLKITNNSLRKIENFIDNNISNNFSNENFDGRNFEEKIKINNKNSFNINNNTNNN
jgi:NhaP-type Na+/H+ and K+/H+ antiporter